MKAADGYIGGPEVKLASFLPARRRSGRRTRGRGGILREPSHRIAVVLEFFCVFERVLRGVHHEVVLIVVLGGCPDRIKRNSDILLAHTEEPTYADDKRGDLAVAIDQYIHDLADLVVRGVIDVLLVPVSGRHAVGGKVCVDLGGRARSLARCSWNRLRGLRARNRGSERGGSWVHGGRARVTEHPSAEGRHQEENHKR